MRAQADMPDDPFFMQLVHVVDIPGVHAGIPVFLRIYIMNHSQVDVSAADALKQVLERRFHESHIPGAHILPVLPGGPDMSLDEPLISGRGNGLPDDIPGLGIRHPAVNNIDSLFLCVTNQLDRFLLRVPFQPLASEADLTYHQSCLSKPTFIHKHLHC